MADIPPLGIPPLRGGFRGRGRGRGGPGTRSAATLPRREQAIRDTDTDAAVSRLSAVTTGLLADPYAAHFVAGPPTRRLPVINRGTYTRTTCIDRLVASFLGAREGDAAGTPERQIISLGAGTDTRFLRLRDAGVEGLLYHEFDFESIALKKEKLASLVVPRPISVLDGYRAHVLDLRELPGKTSLEAFPGVRDDVPTLIISECCLCYLEVEVAMDVLKWWVDRINDLGVVIYEPVRVDDAFGERMVGNLAARGIRMPTLQRYKTLEDQKSRLGELGFVVSEAIDTDQAWERWVSEDEKERVNRLEGLDEVEEWKLLASHYAIVYGSTKVPFGP